MPSVLEAPSEQSQLELELEPEAAEQLPRRRRRRPIIGLVVVAASVVAIVLFLTLGGGDENRTTPVGETGKTPSGAPAMGGSASSQSAVRTVDVQLGEMWIKPSVSTIPAGNVRFIARNVGKVPHELMVERMPIKFDAPGMPTEEAAQGMIEEMGPMHRGQMTMRLKPGKYELFCNVPGHYAAGQHTVLTVPKS